VLVDRLLACEFGNDLRLARQEIAERFDNIDAGKRGARLIASPRPTQRCRNLDAAAGIAQRRYHIARDTAVTDQSNRAHRLHQYSPPLRWRLFLA
jgi:hypothetical protein